MSSDAGYASFLDQANQDVSGGGSASAESTGKEAQLKTVDSAVPAKLKQLGAFYTSEADEPFEPVSLKWEDGDASKLDERKFGDLVGHSGDVEALSAKDFDPKGQYKTVLDAVREEVGGSDVKVFRVATGTSKAEYFVVGVHHGKVLGVKASAVES